MGAAARTQTLAKVVVAAEEGGGGRVDVQRGWPGDEQATSPRSVSGSASASADSICSRQVQRKGMGDERREVKVKKDIKRQGGAELDACKIRSKRKMMCDQVDC